MLKRNGCKVLRSQDKVQRNWLFIESPNDFFLYWLGWMLTDGCIKYIYKQGRNRGVVVDLSIHHKDVKILKFFRDKIQPSATFRKEGNCLRLSLHIDRCCAEILNQWGFIPRKSTKLKPTKKLLALNDKSFLQFLCGVIEGDGCIESRIIKSKQYKYKILRIRLFSASSQFIGWIRQRIINLGFLRRKITKKDIHCYEYSIAGSDAIHLSRLLLRCRFHLLNRKWEKINLVRR
jgi:hypothetical protein